MLSQTLTVLFVFSPQTTFHIFSLLGVDAFETSCLRRSPRTHAPACVHAPVHRFPYGHEPTYEPDIYNRVAVARTSADTLA